MLKLSSQAGSLSRCREEEALYTEMESFPASKHTLSLSVSLLSCNRATQWKLLICNPRQRPFPAHDRWRTRCALGSMSPLALRLRAPFGPSSSSSRKAHTISTPQQKKGSRKKRRKRPPSCSERWQFLMLLPNQLIRDIAYVVISPPFLSDCKELPLVDGDVFGQGDSWHVVAEWLKGLDADIVLQYFEGRRYSTRLGDHFAACIEYVLKFSPFFSPAPLFISQQVEACTIQNRQALKTLKKSIGEFGSFSLRKGGMMSEVIVKLIDNDILVKRFSSYYYDDRGRIKEISDSEIQSRMAGFNTSPFDFCAYGELQKTPLGTQWDENAARDVNLVRKSMLKVSLYGGLDVSTRNLFKWRVCYPSDGENRMLLSGHKVHSYGLAEDRLQHMNKINHQEPTKDMLSAWSPGVKTGGVKGSKTGHSPSENASAVWRNPLKRNTLLPGLKSGQKSGSARRLKYHVELEKGGTAGECDFLFKANTEEASRDYAWTHIHHWEVSIHFLSYVGPWEVFGLATPGCSAWHCSGKKLVAAIEGLDSGMYLETLCQPSNANSGANEISVLDACYVTPTLGDTWLDRKRSLSSKLRLCSYPNMAAKVANLFHFSSKSSKEPCSSTQKPLRGPHGEDYAKYRDDPSILRILPRALAKGYLFYEPELWHHLCMQKHTNKHPVQSMTGDSSQGVRHEFSTSSLNANHWIGWWVYACDFAEFARSYSCEGSMWYIAPRNEWLSPIIIYSSEKHRCGRVLDLVGMLTIILKVGEEASEMQPRRQRRLMVVEVCWDANIRTTVAHPPGCQLQVEKDHRQTGSLKGEGGWVEVNRGFVVEKSWPESREQLAHGLTLSWSPALLGWS